jgi:hypothetical protein
MSVLEGGVGQLARLQKAETSEMPPDTLVGRGPQA